MKDAFFAYNTPRPRSPEDRSFLPSLMPAHLPPKGWGGGGVTGKGLAKKVAKLVGEEVRPPQRLDV
jgi:hypothetical protein